jgi:hypothetical protein
MPKVLFIVKQRQTEYGVSYGLLNSCRFLCNTFGRFGIESKVIGVVDNNAIDKEVYNYNPTHVFIEALWVVPEKFDVLVPLHPNVKWYVRLHSNTPFIASEGIAMQWMLGYEERRKQYGNPTISPNCTKLIDDLALSRGFQTIYAPNIYCPDSCDNVQYTKMKVSHEPNILNVGCFGAIRPMKNHLLQAMAAMAFANEIGMILHFHINGRCEQNGEPIYRNLVNFFAGTEHQLINHPWSEHQEFLGLVREMDMGLQVSFSETFNIVAADMAINDIPVVGSSDIEWLSPLYQCGTTDIHSIVRHMRWAYYGRYLKLQILNKIGLHIYNYRAVAAWMRLLEI